MLFPNNDPKIIAIIIGDTGFFPNLSSSIPMYFDISIDNSVVVTQIIIPISVFLPT